MTYKTEENERRKGKKRNKIEKIQGEKRIDEEKKKKKKKNEIDS